MKNNTKFDPVASAALSAVNTSERSLRNIQKKADTPQLPGQSQATRLARQGIQSAAKVSPATIIAQSDIPSLPSPQGGVPDPQELLPGQAAASGIPDPQELLPGQSGNSPFPSPDEILPGRGGSKTRKRRKKKTKKKSSGSSGGGVANGADDARAARVSRR